MNGQISAVSTTTDQRAIGSDTAASGRTRRAENRAMPMNSSSTPAPSSDSRAVVDNPLANNPTSTNAIPATASSAAPTGRNRLNRPGASVAPSRTAAIGGTRVARQAGRRLARP